VTDTLKILVPSNDLMVALCGQNDELLRQIEEAFEAYILVRGNEITVTAGSPVARQVEVLFEDLVELLERGQRIDSDVLGRTIAMVKAGAAPASVLTHEVVVAPNKTVRPKSLGQKRYAEAIEANTVTFAIGPAGTGKTYLAMAAAIRALQERQVQRIILTRPAVEAGEKLGFLPGDLLAKVDPYLRPLYDALYDLVGPEQAQRLMDRGTVEVAPLAYMRGRTLNDSFIILDEAQNTSPEQMKMFLTRLGFGSKAVVTGDVTQVDLPDGRTSGLRDVPAEIFAIDGVAYEELTRDDVIRHRIVAEIVDAYRKAESSEPRRREAPLRPVRDADGR
jgi:phosphate starvation-inducible PhoH-like protein